MVLWHNDHTSTIMLMMNTNKGQWEADMMRNKSKPQNTIKNHVLIGICILSVSVGFGLYLYQNGDPYQKYNVYQKDHKETGMLKHVVQDEDTYYLSVFYPYFEIDTLDDTIHHFQKQIITDLKQNSKIIIQVDYESFDLSETYISVVFHETLMDEHGKQLSITTSAINYDRTQDKILKTQDVLCGDYVSLLKQKASDANINPDIITTDQLDNFILGKDRITFLIHHDHTKVLSLLYSENKAYIISNIS